MNSELTKVQHAIPLFTRTGYKFIVADIADNLWEHFCLKAGVRLSIIKICKEPGVKYRLKFVRIQTRDIELFVNVSTEVEKAMIEAGYTDYADYCEWLQNRLQYPG